MSDYIDGKSLADRAAELLLAGKKVMPDGLRLLAKYYQQQNAALAAREPADKAVEKTNRQAHEEAAGMGLEDSFFAANGIDPDAPYKPAQAVAVPDGFASIGALIATQDNLATADPLFVVFEKQRCRIDKHDPASERFVTACFTRKGAEAYIAANGHNLREPFIYVASLFRNREMIGLRAAILAAKEKG